MKKQRVDADFYISDMWVADLSFTATLDREETASSILAAFLSFT